MKNHQFSWFCSKTLGENCRGKLGLAFIAILE